MLWNTYRENGLGIHIASNDVRRLDERPYNYILMNENGQVKTARRTLRGKYATPTYADTYHCELVGFVPRPSSVRSTKYFSFPEGAVLCNELMRLDEGQKLVYEFCKDGKRTPDYTHAVTNRIIQITPLADKDIPEIEDSAPFIRHRRKKRGISAALPLPL